MSEEATQNASKVRQKFRRRTVDSAQLAQLAKENGHATDGNRDRDSAGHVTHRRRSQKRTLDDNSRSSNTKVFRNTISRSLKIVYQKFKVKTHKFIFIKTYLI